MRIQTGINEKEYESSPFLTIHHDGMTFGANWHASSIHFGQMDALDTGWEGLAAKANYRPREVAKLCNVSLRTLQRWFMEDYGITVGEWLRTVRLTAAYHRITGGEPIKAVAYELGFKQLSHFSRVFKEVHGVAPSYISPASPRKKSIPPAVQALIDARAASAGVSVAA